MWVSLSHWGQFWIEQPKPNLQSQFQPLYAQYARTSKLPGKSIKGISFEGNIYDEC